MGTTGEPPKVWLAHLASEQYDEESKLVRRKYELYQIPCPRPDTGWVSYRIRCPYCEEPLRWIVQNAADVRWWLHRMALLGGTVGVMSLATLTSDAGLGLFLGLGGDVRRARAADQAGLALAPDIRGPNRGGSAGRFRSAQRPATVLVGPASVEAAVAIERAVCPSWGNAVAFAAHEPE